MTNNNSITSGYGVNVANWTLVPDEKSREEYCTSYDDTVMKSWNAKLKTAAEKLRNSASVLILQGVDSGLNPKQKIDGESLKSLVGNFDYQRGGHGALIAWDPTRFTLVGSDDALATEDNSQLTVDLWDIAARKVVRFTSMYLFRAPLENQEYMLRGTFCGKAAVCFFKKLLESQGKLKGFLEQLDSFKNNERPEIANMSEDQHWKHFANQGTENEAFTEKLKRDAEGYKEKYEASSTFLSDFLEGLKNRVAIPFSSFFSTLKLSPATLDIIGIDVGAAGKSGDERLEILRNADFIRQTGDTANEATSFGFVNAKGKSEDEVRTHYLYGRAIHASSSDVLSYDTFLDIPLGDFTKNPSECRPIVSRFVEQSNPLPMKESIRRFFQGMAIAPKQTTFSVFSSLKSTLVSKVSSLFSCVKIFSSKPSSIDPDDGAIDVV